MHAHQRLQGCLFVGPGTCLRFLGLLSQQRQPLSREAQQAQQLRECVEDRKNITAAFEQQSEAGDSGL